LGTLIKWVGGLWALLGAFTLYSVLSNVGKGPDGNPHATPADTFAFVLTFVLMILPGLAVYALGARLKKSRTSEEPDKSNTRTCPFCAEKIKPEARICRYCQRDLMPIDLQKPI
jgi:hypothetical protein